jgi:hypothetical protein
LEKIADYEEVLERWYRVDVSREGLKKLMKRSNAKGLVIDGKIEGSLYIGLPK